MTATGPPVIVLGVRRSGTTLLRVMLDRNPELAIPDESYFVPQLARRHPTPVDPGAFVDDLRRLPTLVEWQLSPDAVSIRLRAGMTSGEAIGAVFATYAAERGKRRWGDKTPLYMQHLDVLERLFPDARYVHLIRDGRDAALSFLEVSKGLMTEGWGHPRDARGFACQWATEIQAARSLGARVGLSRYLELRYESLVSDPEATLRQVCGFAGLDFDPGMLDYVGRTDSARKEHQQRLNEPPRQGVRNWRTEMAPDDVRAFEDVAGGVLDALGYEVERKGSDRLRIASYRARTAAWRGVGAVVQRSPLWSRRHPPLHATLRDATTPPELFRRMAVRISLLLAAEATRDVPSEAVTVQTPLGPAAGRRIVRNVVVVPVLRAGLGMLDAVLELIPTARVGHIGLQRDEITAVASQYYSKLPADLSGSFVLMIDPMLATGGSAVAALDLLRHAGARDVRMICIVAAPEGIALVEKHHRDVAIYTPVVDQGLNAHKFIVPGLGDFGDRLYGTT